MPFSTLIGNPKARNILTRLLANHALPSVLLFYGTDGVGKGLFALEIARFLVDNPKKDHPDIHILKPDPKSDQHPIATIRALLQEASLPPFEAPCKIFIIHDAEKMLPTSSNALLKTLEEPPPRTRFILLTSQIESLLPTIVSRCCRIPFFPIGDDELATFVTEKCRTQEGKKIALFAQGSIAYALHRASNPKSLPLDELFRAKSYVELVEKLSKIEEPPEEATGTEIDHLFEEILYWIREHDPLQLDKAIPLIAEARMALNHHVKFKNVLEHFFLNFLT